MKILLISVFRDGTGYSHGAAEYAKALNTISDVVIRSVKLNPNKGELDDLLIELENKSSKDCDVNIQYILPHLMEWNGHFKQNIALFASETSNYCVSNWPEKLNLMDKVFLINSYMKTPAIESGVKRPLHTIGHPINLNKCHKNYDKFKLPNQSFKFYFIGEWNRRKNTAAMLKAFHLEFDVDENVDLVIKTSGSLDRVVDDCNKLKVGLKLYPKAEQYKQELIITSRLSEEEIMQLHSACDCFVCPSYGEAFCIPAVEASASGKPIIVTDGIGTCDFVNNETSWIVRSHKEAVFGMMDSFADLYNGNETWQSINVPDLRKAMREAYENKDLYNEKASNSIDYSLNFSYEKIGAKMLEAINV